MFEFHLKTLMMNHQRIKNKQLFIIEVTHARLY